MGNKVFVIVGLVAMMVLGGCGGATEASSPASPTASPIQSKADPIMPNIAGMAFRQAREALVANGITYEAIGSDGVKFKGRPTDSVTVEKADTPAGAPVPGGGPATIHMQGTEAGQKAESAAAAEAARRALRYDFSCSTQGVVGSSASTPEQHFHTVKAVWSDPSFKKFDSCDGEVGGVWWHDHYTLESDEQAVVNQVGADGGDISVPSAAYSDVLAACMLPPKSSWGRTGADNYRRWVQATAKSAVKMCPDAPFIAQLQHVASGEPDTNMSDGTYVVGKDIAAGTYQVQTTDGVHDCYWERTAAQGATLANDFITFAPQGPVVTVYSGEGFVSKGCGAWQKIG